MRFTNDAVELAARDHMELVELARQGANVWYQLRRIAERLNVEVDEDDYVRTCALLQAAVGAMLMGTALGRALDTNKKLHRRVQKIEADPKAALHRRDYNRAFVAGRESMRLEMQRTITKLGLRVARLERTEQ